MAICLATIFLTLSAASGSERIPEKDKPLRLATGNLSVDAIQHSPIGASVDPNFKGSFPQLEDLKRLKQGGLEAYEDYIAWGMIEPEEGRFDFSHHDKMERLLKDAGLSYIPYIWCHVPPVWLRKDSRATLMRCNAHGEECYMLSIFDPRTLEWYKHFYQALHKHFGDRILETYACILGPYGEGNYPLPYVDWVVKLGHCHEGYWCGDSYALPAFRKAMREKYGNIMKLNSAWNAGLKSFEEIIFPPEIAGDSILPLDQRPVKDRRKWLDFIQWYHGALVRFAGESTDMVTEIFGKDRVSVKPGGNAGWMNPLSWGTYCPAFAKMAGERNIPVQSADSRGAYWADKWGGTAYVFYGAEYRTEAAGALDRESFIKRTFSDVSCGSSRLFTYEIDNHISDAMKYLRLFTGERGMTEIALLAPTTKYFLNGDVMPAVNSGMELRDVVDYDVLDELLIKDGILDSGGVSGKSQIFNYRILVAFDCDVVERDIIERILKWVDRGGVLIWASSMPLQDVEGKTDFPINTKDSECFFEEKVLKGGVKFGNGRIHRIASETKQSAKIILRIASEQSQISSIKGCIDGKKDGVWITEFPSRLLLFNLGKTKVERSIEWNGKSHKV
ncbi:beta-galactosidase, partial [Candidatus Sumerlaeota bacterium]|nr:beta-galactosidase [Candidatus Sumerlaeota bacterium]